MNWYKQAQVNTGYRAEGSYTGVGTEGNGVYIAHDISLAKFFGDNIVEIQYRNPSKPLVVNEEPLPLLQDDYPIFAPISPQDSEWIKINKQAVINSGVTENEWDVEKAARFLTVLLKMKGYDAVRVTSGGETWDVLLNPSLIVSSKPVKAKQAQNVENIIDGNLTPHKQYTNIGHNKKSVPSLWVYKTNGELKAVNYNGQAEFGHSYAISEHNSMYVGRFDPEKNICSIRVSGYAPSYDKKDVPQEMIDKLKKRFGEGIKFFFYRGA